jgi:hypothetical protein
MAISFVRSLRSLENHSARPSAAALLTAGSLMALWMLWVGFAPVEIHETSTDWQRTREGALVVRFPDTPHRMRNRLEADTVKVELLSGAPPKATPRGSVKILVERVTPLTLMLRAGEPILDATRGVTP